MCLSLIGQETVEHISFLKVQTLAGKRGFQCVSPLSQLGNHDSSQPLFNAVVTETLDSSPGCRIGSSHATE